MKRIIAVAVAIATMNGVALAAEEGSEFWTGLFWEILNFIADAGGMWQL